jgi:hypothetical protein
MGPLNLSHKLKINWWLWMALSIPPIVYSWLRPRDVKGSMVSDWAYLMDYLHQTGYSVTHDIWNFFGETFFWSAVPALLVGWILQYVITLAWEGWRAKTRRAGA